MYPCKLPLVLLAALGAVTTAPGAVGPTLDSAGALLVAEPELDDPNFDHTVVVLLHHDAEGALGLVVNRRYGRVPTADLLRRLGLDAAGASGETELFYGGPVQPDLGTVLHRPDYQGSDTRAVAPGLAATSDPAILRALATGQGPSQARVVLGYAGWGPGQLEDEIGRNGWLTCEAAPDLVFSERNDSKWQRALKTLGVDPLTLSAAAGRA